MNHLQVSTSGIYPSVGTPVTTAVYTLARPTLSAAEQSEQLRPGWAGATPVFLVAGGSEVEGGRGQGDRG